MRVRTAVLLSVVVLVCGVGSAQNDRLSDVAGTIKLNPEAIVEKDGYVEDPQGDKRADENLFGSALAECSVTAERMAALVEEARNTILYADSEIKARLEGIALDLELQARDLNLLRLTESFDEAMATARMAAAACVAASESVRDELGQGGVAFTTAKELSTRCVDRLDRAKVQMVAAMKSETESSGTADSGAGRSTTASSDDEIIAARCASEHAPGSENYDVCEGAQYRALAALSSRDAANELLDEALFAGIRDICNELHPGDFAARDSCEQEKMTAARLELE